VGGLISSMPDDSFFHVGLYAVLRIGYSTTLLEKGIDSTFIYRFLIAIEGVSRDAHYLAGLGDISQFVRQIQQTYLVFDNTFVTIKHEGYLLCVLISGLGTFIKTANPLLFKSMCQIWSELFQLILTTNQRSITNSIAYLATE
jgi:hypothetical protein